MVTGVICLLWAVQFSLTGEVLTDGTYCVQTANNILDPEYFLILYNIIVPVTYSYGPFTIMGITNCAIIYKFMMAKWKSRYNGTQSTNQALSKSATRGTAMLLTVSFTFIILTGPLAIANAV